MVLVVGVIVLVVLLISAIAIVFSETFFGERLVASCTQEVSERARQGTSMLNFPRSRSIENNGKQSDTALRRRGKGSNSTIIFQLSKALMSCCVQENSIPLTSHHRRLHSGQQCPLSSTWTNDEKWVY